MLLPTTLFLATATATTPTLPPNIVILFVDNLGWANVGYHRPPALDPSQLATPNIDALAASGLELDRHYTYKFCSPSRSSLMSGRLPFHVNIYNDDPALPGQGVPVGMTLLPLKLKQSGAGSATPTPYATHFIGKWHIGMASKTTQIPIARGFDTSLGYFHSTNNYYNSHAGATHQAISVCGHSPAVDLYLNDGPATTLNGSSYEERIFGARAVCGARVSTDLLLLEECGYSCLEECGYSCLELCYRDLHARSAIAFHPFAPLEALPCV
jgi:arylsulfatase I/J